MKTLLFAALACALASPPAADLQSTYTVGESRTTLFNIEESSSLTSVQVILNGEESPSDEEMQQDQDFGRGGTFTDKILRAEDGELSAFTRTYSDLMSDRTMDMINPMGEQSLTESASESELDDVTVLFTLDEGELVASYPEGEQGDEELIDGLLGHLPFAEFLPEGEVEVDAEWEVEPRLIWDVLNLGGDLSLVDPEADAEDTVMMEALDDDELVEISGQVNATLDSLEDGLATITLEIEMIEYRDLTEALNGLVDGSGEAVPEMELAESEKQYEGEGTLVWDMGGGYMVSMELELTLEDVQIMHINLPFGPDDMSVEQTMISEGEITASFEVEVTRD